MAERVRVTDPDGECGYGCDNDLRGLYGCLRNYKVSAREHAEKEGKTYGT